MIPARAFGRLLAPRPLLWVLLGAWWGMGGLRAQPILRLTLEAGDTTLFAEAIQTFRPRPQRAAADVYVFPLSDTNALAPFGRALLRFFHEKSFLAAAFDSLYRSDGGKNIFSTNTFALPDSVERIDNAVFIGRLHLGPALRWVSLRPSAQTDERWLDAAGFREKLFADKPLRPAALLRMQTKLLEQAENNGYPFAAVWLDSLVIRDDGGVSAILRMARNQYFALKILRIQGDVRLPKGYLPNYLGLRLGQAYDRAKILRVRERLRALSFLDLGANPTVTFLGDEATLNLFLQKKRASRFDFLIGLLPRTNADDRPLLITGNLNAAFQNALNLGERLSAEIERLRPETQRLDVRASVPYLFGLPFGADGHLNIFKRDSTWLDAASDLGVQYFFEGNNQVKFFWENKSSSLLSVDTATVRRTRRLPPNLDLRQQGFGLAAVYEHLDYRFNPRKGWSLAATAVAGFSSVRRNDQVEAIQDAAAPAFRFSSLYDSLASRVARYRLEGKIEGFVPLFVRSTLKIAASGGALLSPSRAVFANELTAWAAINACAALTKKAFLPPVL